MWNVLKMSSGRNPVLERSSPKVDTQILGSTLDLDQVTCIEMPKVNLAWKRSLIAPSPMSSDVIKFNKLWAKSLYLYLQAFFFSRFAVPRSDV